MIALVCWLALTAQHTVQAQTPARFSNQRNRTSHVRITKDQVSFQQQQKEEKEAKVDSNNQEETTMRSLSTTTAPSSASLWFRIESTAMATPTQQCVAVLNGKTDFDTLIHLTDCDDSDKTLWTQSTEDNYYVRSKLNPTKCIVTTGRFLMLKNCPDSSSSSTNSDEVVSLPTDAAFEAYDDDTIRQRSNSNKCWQAHAIHKGLIELGACGGSSENNSNKQHWSATTVIENVVEVKKAAKEAELTARGYDNWMAIQSKKNSNLCIAVQGGEAKKLASIALVDCNLNDEAQLWTHASSRADPTHHHHHTKKIGMIRSKLDPDMCLVPSGSANAHVPLILWYCDPAEEFGSWTLYDDDSSIRSTKDSHVCLDTFEYQHGVEVDSEFKHDVVVGTCPDNNNNDDGQVPIEVGQQWTTMTAYASVAEAKVVSAKDNDDDDAAEWMTIQNQGSGNCLTVEGGEALKLAPVVLNPCNRSSDAQLWEHASARVSADDPTHAKIGMIRSKLDPDMCLVPSGSAELNVPLILWNCDPSETFGSWALYYDDSSIRTTHDPTKCLDTHELDGGGEEEDEFKHDVVVGTCPGEGYRTGSDSQKWVTNVVI